MARATKKNDRSRDVSRIRTEIVEAAEGLRRVGAIGEAELRRTTLRMLGREALPCVSALSPEEITEVRRRAGVSQAVMAGYLNVAVNTISQWERGERRPTGAALKLLHVVKTKGLEAVS